ncbi:MAG: DUF4124 domain-containing protein [Burkholderiaceae bacterium]|jgi:hypothetical protein|nr:DUF4124 domain-containing protein [Burkholderiaceae bacterium]
MNRPRLILAALLALAALPSTAQDIQRCEGAGGTVTYASGACPPGSAAVRTLPAVAAPDAAEQQAARQRAQRDARSAAELDRARLAMEQSAAREQQQAVAQASRQQAQCRRLLTGLRHAREDLAEARPAKRAEARRRLARAEDLYRDDCGPPRD